MLKHFKYAITKVLWSDFMMLDDLKHLYIFFQKYLICPITTVFEKISISDTNQKQQKIGPVGDSPWCVDAVYQV